MAVNIHSLIAAISPDIYCKRTENTQNPTELIDKVKKTLKELLAKKDPKAYLSVAEFAKAKDTEFVDFEKIDLENPFSTPGFELPVEKHILSYDLSNQSLEPIYFWILEKLPEDYKETDKLIDNFVSSPGSGHFSEIGTKSTRMQEEAMKIMQTIGVILKSLIQIVYDLKEYKMVLKNYEDYSSNDKEEKKAALLSLKQRWLDNVDIRRQTTSIKGLAQQFDYVTLIDAFMSIESLEKLKDYDYLNDRVKRILSQRLQDFFNWLKISEQELKKRYEIERQYLKSQVNSVKLYAHWAKPYLKATKQLEQKARETAEVVTLFNTTIMELAIMGKRPYKPEEDVGRGDLPKIFLKEKIRRYTELLVIELKYRSIPDRVTQQGGYSFRGKVEIVFTSYALNEDELKVLKDQMEKDDLGDIFGAIEGATTESIGQLQTDIDELLGDKDKKKTEEKKEKPDDTNPFSALISIFKKEEKKVEKKDPVKDGLIPDSPLEKAARSQAIIDARKRCRKFYGSFKKANNMPNF